MLLASDRETAKAFGLRYPCPRALLTRHQQAATIGCSGSALDRYPCSVGVVMLAPVACAATPRHADRNNWGSPARAYFAEKPIWRL